MRVAGLQDRHVYGAPGAVSTRKRWPCIDSVFSWPPELSAQRPLPHRWGLYRGVQPHSALYYGCYQPGVAVVGAYSPAALNSVHIGCHQHPSPPPPPIEAISVGSLFLSTLASLAGVEHWRPPFCLAMDHSHPPGKNTTDSATGAAGWAPPTTAGLVSAG